MDFVFNGVEIEEVNKIDALYQENLQVWWEELAFLRERLKKDQSLQLMPIVVVLAYKHIDSDNRLALDMGGLFKTLYFANLIHNQIKDEEEGQLNDQSMQFTILIGDYIFGRVLKLLLKIDAVQVLDNLAGMICNINEGLVMQYKLAAEKSEVIKRGNASIYETAFLTAARLKMLDQEAVELYGQLGFNIGMAMELLIAEKTSQVLPYIETSRVLLTEFTTLGFKHNCLFDLLQGMTNIAEATTPIA